MSTPENPCVASGCPAACCRRTYFQSMSPDQFKLYKSYLPPSIPDTHANPESGDTWLAVRLVASITKHQEVFYRIRPDGNVEVQVTGWCGNLDQPTRNCNVHGSIRACNGLQIGDVVCSAYRKVEGLPPLKLIQIE